MNFGIIGSGGREHALCHSLKKSKLVKKIFCFPGNAGTSEIAENIDIDLGNLNEFKKLIIQNKIDLIIVGPEKPLVEGIVDFLEKNNIKVFGPNKIASQLEGSKIFTKQVCKKYEIPTANFGVFETSNDAKNFIQKSKLPLVIKADGLASGKGVYICENLTSGFEALDEIFNGKFGVAKNVLVEEYLDGEEMSFFVISDGVSYQEFGTAQDHKRVGEGDKGKNTGGMGAYSPSRLINSELRNKIINKIINPTLNAIKDLGTTYKGFLYAGLMIKDNEPYLIEYNVRMGDPECQTILPKLKTDFGELILACCESRLKKIDIQWSDQKSLCVVLCAIGYPDEYKKNLNINNFENIKLDKQNYCFHAGTKKENDKIKSIGGRVLNFVGLSETFLEARKNVIKNIEVLNWSGFYRSDIGYKVIDNK